MRTHFYCLIENVVSLRAYHYVALVFKLHKNTLMNWQNERFDVPIFSTNFHHDLRRHGDVFRAVVVITQLAINNGEKPFKVKFHSFKHLS